MTDNNCLGPLSVNDIQFSSSYHILLDLYVFTVMHVFVASDIKSSSDDINHLQFDFRFTRFNMKFI